MTSIVDYINSLDPIPSVYLCLLKYCAKSNMFGTNEDNGRSCKYLQSYKTPTQTLTVDAPDCVLNVIKLDAALKGSTYIYAFSGMPLDMRQTCNINAGKYDSATSSALYLIFKVDYYLEGSCISNNEFDTDGNQISQTKFRNIHGSSNYGCFTSGDMRTEMEEI